MKRFKGIIVASFAVVALGVVGVLGVGSVTSNVSAQSAFKEGETITQTKKVDGSFFAAGSTIQVTEAVNGDVYVGGQSVTISGDVSGDVLVMGQNVTINGDVDGSVRVVAQTLTINGEVKGGVSALAQTFTVSEKAAVAGDVSFVSQSATIDGTAARDVSGVVERLHIGGSVGRDINYVSEVALTKNESATISGQSFRTAPMSHEAAAPTFESKVTGWLYFVAASVFAVLLVALIAPRWLKSATERAYSPTPWKAILAGFLAIVLVPFAIIVLLITIIGIPVAIFLTLAYIILGALGFVFSAYYIGRLVLRNKQPVVMQGITGALIYSVLLLIPIIGGIAWVVGGLIGVGIVALDVAKRTSNGQATKSKK